MAKKATPKSKAKPKAKPLTPEQKAYQEQLAKVKEPYRTIGDALMNHKSHKAIARLTGESIHRVKHLIRLMKTHKDSGVFELFKDVL